MGQLLSPQLHSTVPASLELPAAAAVQLPEQQLAGHSSWSAVADPTGQSTSLSVSLTAGSDPKIPIVIKRIEIK